MVLDVIRLLSSGREPSAGVACLHRGTICFKGRMQIGDRSQDRNENMTLWIVLKNWAENRRPGEGHGNMLQCMFQYYKHCYKNNDNQLLSMSSEGRMSRNKPNLQQRIFRLDIRKTF